MTSGKDGWTYSVEINGEAAREMTIATSYMESAASAAPGIFAIEEEQFPLHIKIWIDDLVSDRNPPSEWVIWRPGDGLQSGIVDSEEVRHSVRGLGRYFGALARGPADLRDYLETVRDDAWPSSADAPIGRIRSEN